MEQRVTIQNKELTVEISSLGAEIKSVKKDGVQMMWSGDPAVWNGVAPILFPICGSLKEDKYQYEGREYTLSKHGFIKYTLFEVESQSQEQVVFVTRSNEKTRESYPFDFEFRAAFRLSGSTLSVEYGVKNCGRELYFSLGAHEAYACPEGIEEYGLLFDQEETFDSTRLEGSLIREDTIRVSEPSRLLPLKESYFKEDTLVFQQLKSRKVTLAHQNSSKKITLSFPGHDYFMVWHKPGGRYICLEPWCGLPDEVGSSYDFTRKKGIIRLTDEAVYSHQITFELSK